MYNNTRALLGPLAAVFLLIDLSACGWVDSTGVQGTTVEGTLRNASPISVTEGVPLMATLSGEGANLRNWQWTSDNSDARSRCANLDGFDQELSKTTLFDACGNSSECALILEEVNNDANATQFTIVMPALRASVALSYRLTAIRDDGATVERQQLLCGIAINEAPSANDDSYVAQPNELLLVSPSDSNNLLANDEDDNDVRNMTLSVAGVIKPPQFASEFTLGEFGGFSYTPVANIDFGSSSYVEDNFEYSISDGLHTATGTAFIRIVPSNEAPQQRQLVPDLTFLASTQSSNSIIIDLSRYFSDPDGDTLMYSTSAQLPESGNIVLTQTGLLRINATLAEVGNYGIELNVSDGIESISDTFTLSIEAPIVPNNPPVVTDISNHTVQNQFTYDVSGFFTDPDGDALSYSAIGLPSGVSISKKGVISGTASRLNRGNWFVFVTATDTSGYFVTDRFRLQIK